MSEQKKDAGDYTGDPHWGKGGRFVVDPATGQRMPVVEEEPVPAVPEASEAEAIAAEKSKPLKEKNRA